MSAPTIPQVIARGGLSIALAANDNSKGALFSPRKAAPGSPVTIAMVTDALTWGYVGGAQTAADLQSMANYLIWLIGMYGQQAQVLIDGGGGGTVIPISQGGAVAQQYDFIVTGSTFIIAGAVAKQFPVEWIGRGMNLWRGGDLQSTTVPSFGNYYAWDSTNAILYLLAVAPSDPSAQTDERFQISPV